MGWYVEKYFICWLHSPNKAYHCFSILIILAVISQSCQTKICQTGMIQKSKNFLPWLQMARSLSHEIFVLEMCAMQFVRLTWNARTQSTLSVSRHGYGGSSGSIWMHKSKSFASKSGKLLVCVFCLNSMVLYVHVIWLPLSWWCSQSWKKQLEWHGHPASWFSPCHAIKQLTAPLLSYSCSPSSKYCQCLHCFHSTLKYCIHSFPYCSNYQELNHRQYFIDKLTNSFLSFSACHLTAYR